jgi:hypothetical protein
MVEEQPVRAVTFEVDGEPRKARVRPDFVVVKGGRRYVADAKAGADATDLGKRGSRRQLLEYALAFGETDGILLIDTEAGAIHSVSFPGVAGVPRPARSRAALAFGVGIVVGTGAGVALAELWMSSR